MSSNGTTIATYAFRVKNTLCVARLYVIPYVQKKMLLSLCFRATLYTYTYVRPHVVGTKWGHFKLPSIIKRNRMWKNIIPLCTLSKLLSAV